MTVGPENDTSDGQIIPSADWPRAPTLLILPDEADAPDSAYALGRGLAASAGLLIRPPGLDRTEPPNSGRLGPTNGVPSGVNRFLASAARQFTFDRRRIVVVGHGTGACVSADWLGRGHHAPRAAVLFHACPMPIPDPAMTLDGVQVLLTGSPTDLASAMITQALCRRLMSAGATVTVTWCADDLAPGGRAFRSARVWLRLTGLVTD
jgi:hypothetical protein